MRLETLEKALDALKEIDEHFLACTHILRGLRGASLMITYIKRSTRRPHQEHDTDTGKYHICGREYLIDDNQSTDCRETAS
jgi:hypothetical protein